VTTDVESAVRAVLETALDEALDARGIPRRHPATPEATLVTPRQVKVLQAAAEGHDIAATARVLGVDAATVSTHRAAARKRLGAVTTTHAVVIALHEGLIQWPHICTEADS
jgi:DNA-binding NarL/FixJ family response regulator